MVGQLNTDSLKHFIATSTDEKELRDAYHDYAYQLYRIQSDCAIYYAIKALTIAENLNDSVGIYSAYNLMGLAYQTKGMYNFLYRLVTSPTENKLFSKMCQHIKFILSF